MSLNPERVTLVINGMAYSGWKTASVRASMRESVRVFEVTTTELSGPLASEYNFPPGTPVEVYANSDLVVKGYVNVYRPSFNATSHTVQISGRGRGQDWVDCSAQHQTGNFKKKKPDAIAKELDKWGLGLEADVELDEIEYAQLMQGETNQDFLERLLRDQGASMVGQPDGSIKITNASVAKKQAGGLIEGHNIKSADATLTDDRRFSETIVKGQRRHGVTASDLRIKESAKDGGVKRHRPKIIVQETDSSPKRAKKRAQHESDRAKGFSVKASIVTQGWRDDGGGLWTPNKLVFVHSPTLKLAGDMLIESVNFSQAGDGNSPAGSLTTLSLVDPKAYKGKGGKASKSGKQWSE